MITANFSGLPSGEVLRLSDRLWQYDTGQQLKIQGLSGINENTEVHFALKHTNRAIVKSGEFNAEDTTLTVDIPNLFLAYADGVPAKVWVHLRDSETSARTIREIQIPVEPREKPDGYITPGDPSDRAFVEAIVEERIIVVDNEIANLDARIKQISGGNVSSVLDYGAVGDGVADDSIAVRNAIKNSNILIFPPGRYKVTGAEFEGLSDKTLIFKAAGLIYEGEKGESVLKFSDCDNIGISGGVFDGSNTVKFGLNFVNTTNVKLDNVSVKNIGNENTASASGINFTGDCSYSKLNNVYVDGVTSGQSDGSYIFAHGIGFIRSSTGPYSKYVEINHPVIKNVGYVDGKNYVGATAVKDSDDKITGYKVGDNTCTADIIEKVDGEYRARIDGDGIFLVQSRWGNVHDGIESYFKINNVDISRCSKRALKIAARCVDVDGGEIDVATWSAAVEVQRVRHNSLRNLKIKDTTYTPVTINGGDGPMVIENCQITGGGMSSKGSGGIVLGAKSTGKVEGSEIVHIENCVFDNVKYPIYAAINSAAAGKTDCEELVIKNCLIEHFYGDAAIMLEEERYQRLGKLTIENVSFTYGTNTLTVFFNNNNSYNQSIPLNSRLFNFFSPEKTIKVMCDNLSDDFREIFESYNLTTPNQIFEISLQPDTLFKPDEQVKLTSGDYDSDGESKFKASVAGNTVILSETSDETSNKTYVKGQRVIVPLKSSVTVKKGERLFLTIYNSHPRTGSVNDLTVNFYTDSDATQGALSFNDKNYGVAAGYIAYAKKKTYEVSLKEDKQELVLTTMVIRANADVTTITEETEITVSLKTEKKVLKDVYTKAEVDALIEDLRNELINSQEG